jgi:S-DNA-T family DNA segregation ATPase FtsK/SpoIIIE
MAATRRSTTTAPSRSRSRSARGTATRRKPPAQRASAARRPAPRRRATPKWRQELARQLGGHSTDALAIGLFVLALVSALGIYSNLAGPVGGGLDAAASIMLGAGRVVVPLALLVAAGGVLVTRGEPGQSRSDLRLGFGIVLVCAAIVGLLHIGHGSPGGDALEPLQHAGGLLGALFGAPLHALLGGVGAVIVLVAVLVLGALLVFGAGLKQVAVIGFLAVKWLAEHGKGLFTLQPVPLDDAYEPDRPLLYDQVAEELETSIGPLPEADIDLVAAEDSVEKVTVFSSTDEVLVGDVEISLSEGEDEDEDDADATVDGELPDVAWKLPPPTILKRSQSREVDPRMVAAGGEVLEATLREFGVDARLVGATVGPTVTRYELEIAPGVKVNRVTNLAKEIAYSMASHDVRILAPIPGRSAIGVEVPNKARPVVTLGDILASDETKKATHPLEVAMGRDIAGRAVMSNLATFPHVLIAGQTGAGKSSCINSIVTSLLMRTSPQQVRLILVDPKRVELGQYNAVPHLLTEVVTNPKKAANALDWAVREMEMRYDILAGVGVRDITGYNAMYDRGELPTIDDPDPDTGKHYERLPFIVVVVDELADLMMVAARDVETSICRLAQMARAVGIHLVIATQRPSVDVITGVIKANIPSRLAFSVSTLADSRVILDQPGAEKLIGKGDMLMLTASSSRTERIQGAWVDEECVRKVVAHWRRQTAKPNYVEGIQGDDSPGGARAGGDDYESDELLDEALELVVRSGLGSTSMLQRKLRVGFARAGRLMDLLEQRGIVGPSEGSKARAVLMTVDELEAVRARE